MGFLRQCVYGAAIGDAMGVPYEFRPRGSFECHGMTGYGSHNKPAGTWSDDTSMILAELDCWADTGSLEDVMSYFRRWLHDEEYTVDGIFDVGMTTARAIDTGKPQCHRLDSGNGAVMRCVPLAILPVYRGEAMRSLGATHGSPESMGACGFLYDFTERMEYGEMADFPTKCPEVAGGYCWDTVDAALWALESSESFDDAVLNAVNLGGDTDTNACVAGALAAIFYGGVNEEWLSEIRGREIIDRVLDKAERRIGTIVSILKKS
jgi:ADP-ribosylglycohydrolase|nr:MAG TPA: ADP-ribosylglycohydrolase [Caudoviricetes sp.]